MTDLAKRVRELEEAIGNESWSLTLVLDPDLLRALLAERRKLVEALEWYADEGRYDPEAKVRDAAVVDGGARSRIALGWMTEGYIACEACHRLVPPDEIVRHRPANWDGTDDDVATYQCEDCTGKDER